MTEVNPFEPVEVDRSGLGDLFADMTETEEPSSDLGNLFERDGTENQTESSPKPFKAGSAVRTKAIPAGVPDEYDESSRKNLIETEYAPVSSSHEGAETPQSPWIDSGSRQGTTSAGPTQDPYYKDNDRTTPVPAEALGVSRDWNLAKSSEAALDRRYTDGDRLWPIVDQVMAVAGSDPTIQSLASKLELINNSEADKAQKNEIIEALKPKLGSAGIVIPDPNDIVPVLQMAYDELVGISVLGPIWRDPEITEIMVDRWDIITVERHGKLENTPIKFRNEEHANSVARSLALRVSDRAVSRTINLVTAELPSARVQFAYGPVVKGGLSITIRKFRDLLGLEDLKNFGALSDEMEEFLKSAVLARSGILVSGGTGTGKTTIVNLLSNFIPGYERVLTIEDAFEMQLSAEHVVSLQTKEASSSDDAVNVTLAHLLRASLRMRPDRIIVGEIREGEGASVMLAAANTGHDGTMTTIHANSVDMALNERLVDLVRQMRSSSDEAIRRTIVNAFDLVVQVSRGRKGNRYISQIAQVDRTFIQNGVIKPLVLFQGEDNNGKTSFKRTNSIDPTTELGERLKSLDHTKWLGEAN